MRAFVASRPCQAIKWAVIWLALFCAGAVSLTAFTFLVTGSVVYILRWLGVV